ncbi:unnamed protein product, partial [Meganyctiphanes norvegica]
MRGYSSLLKIIKGISSRRVVYGSQQQQQYMVQLAPKRGVQTSSCRQEVYTINGEEDFKAKVMDSKLPVIVNFHADWCEPCQSLKPMLEEIANKHSGRIHLAEAILEMYEKILTNYMIARNHVIVTNEKGMEGKK